MILTNTKMLKSLLALVLGVGYLTSILYILDRNTAHQEYVIEDKWFKFEELWKAAILIDHDKPSATFISENPEILSIINRAAQADYPQRAVLRRQLYDLMQPYYEKLRETGIHQLHFVLPDGTSFLRMHAPEHFGDNLNEVRNSYRLVNTYKKVVSGFELGKVVSGYRYVQPLFIHGHHIGAFELSTKLEQIKKNFNALDASQELAFLLTPGLKNMLLEDFKDSYKSLDFAPGWYLEDPNREYFFDKAPLSAVFLSSLENISVTGNLLEKLDAKQKFIETQNLQGHSYTITFTPINDLSNHFFGYVVARSSAPMLDQIKNDLLLNIALTTLIFLFLSIIGLILIRNIQSRLIAANVFDAKTAMLITNAKGKICKVNSEFTRLTGYKEEEVIGKSPSLLSSGRQDKAFYRTMWDELLSKRKWQGEIWNRKKNGEEYCENLTISVVEDNFHKIRFFVGSFYDVTGHKKDQEKIKLLSSYDSLTGLVNRSLFENYLEANLKTALCEEKSGGLLYININRFKFINDLEGFELGNQLLKTFSRKLKSRLKSNEILARFGSDRFGILLLDIASEEEIEQKLHDLCEKLLQLTSKAIKINQEEYHIGLSIGAVTFGNNGLTTVDNILLSAESTTHEAKQHGQNQVQFLTKTLLEKFSRRRDLQTRFKTALLNREFTLYYQPQHDRFKKVKGVEALIRWNHPQYGLLFPDDFIPLAEDTGFIEELGLWVIEEACHTIEKWQSSTVLSGIPISVNVSAKQLYQDEFYNRVSGLLQNYHIPQGLLKFELTESMVISNAMTAERLMKLFINKGIHFALDDFGTGFSSLLSLKNLPFSQVKIDKSFVFEILEDKSAAVLTKNTIALANELGLDIVAEGVESEEHKNILEKMGCHLYQGYLFSKPQPYSEIAGYIRQYNRKPSH
ncbi:EAL domain-containing protein [Thiomicrorhabdus xiamenensis]|uniref:EAL domain-containing protein n=1 Tax=Thiomicrorhabdus xiamenensis TaxID=2739063 RepID=A0A7D4TFZ9_9GAMM|nr:EAL domain-containing protein [Thiomicrorhabdus xiamenensis]QKI89248.1 EAL domain-containing protein [Thiomicrorhabdus xiamenensis]